MTKVLRIGILGTGWIAEKMARTISGMDEERGIQLFAVASRSLDKARLFATQWNIPKAFGSYDELASDKEVDLIYVATPHSEHFNNVMMAMQHEKAVLCEKAFTACAWQTEEILSYAHQHKVFVTEAIWTRYMPFSQEIVNHVNSGIIGTPKMLTANLCYPNISKPRMHRPDLAGGALLDLGVYTLNFAAMIFGTDIVSSVSTAILTDTGVDASNTIVLNYSNNRQAVLSSSNLVKSDRQGIISGDKGHIIVDNINNPNHIDIVGNDYQKIASFDCPKQITGYEYQVYACADALSKGLIESPFMPHNETLRIMRQMDDLRAQWGVRYPWDK
ncbi:MAG: Gfo/Idh/MocA family oxidoreductase [Marinilabiliaceae bacterium]|nr:Gfo/Idh/MocA family oxidoreductase [Marinilabiliaceae bacterium]